MKKQIIRGTIITASASVAVALLLAVILMYQIYHSSLEDRLQTMLVLFASQVETEGIEEEHIRDELESLEDYMLAADQDLRFSILDRDGLIIADSEASNERIGDSRADRPEVQAALKGEWGYNFRTSDTIGRRYLYAAKNFDNFIFRAALPADEYGDLLSWLLLGAIFCFAIGIITAVLFGRRIASGLTKPVESLTDATKAIAAGDMGKRVGAYPAELGQLGTSFNQMAEQLEAATLSYQQRNDELHSIISGIQDGIIAIQGDEMRPFLLTEQAVEMLGPYSKSYDSLQTYGANYSKLAPLARRAISMDMAIQDMIELSYPHDAIINVYAAPFGDPEEKNCVLVLHDVTRMTKLERIRSEFVANVTHELKTPLTSIRGYIQLLKSAKRDSLTRESFYEIIEIETDRLMTLISDLLDLSEIENRGKSYGESSTGIQSCLLYEVALEVKEQLDPLLQERGVTIDIDMPWDIEVAAEYKRILQMLSNLVSNAVIYNRPGGSVWIHAMYDRDMANIRVRDNGIGIPEEHQERIFERFYRVSKDRSREFGGTGLGLSIVKHIVNLYEGSISMDSKEGEGTVFHIRLPLARHTEDLEVDDAL